MSDLPDKIYDICIIGGGASGTASAISAKKIKPEASLLIIEKNSFVCRKIKATGNGKCNITNINAKEYQLVSRFFDSVGIVTRTYENGLVYPYSESAADVSNMLLSNLKKHKIPILLSSTVLNIDKTFDKNNNKIFEIDILEEKEDGIKNKFTVCAKNIIIATGGKAGPIFGSTGDGYRFARAFGHRVVKTIPILAGIECRGNEFKYLQGVRVKGRINLIKSGINIFTEDGEVQFTKYGISGIAVFNMTRFMRLNEGETFNDFEISIDICNGIDILPILKAKAKMEANIEDMLTTITKPEISRFIIDKLKINNTKNLSDDKKLELISDLVHNLKFNPVNIRSWKEAQCTSGGVDLNELDENYQSKKECGVFFTGEVIDYDGPCGGYNLTNAFASGIRASKGAVKRLG